MNAAQTPETSIAPEADGAPPRLDSLYPFATIRLASTFDPEEEDAVKARLLFASVELRPPGLPRPGTSHLDRRASRGKPGTTLFYREVGLTCADALAWYRSAGGPAFVTPTPLDPDDRGPGDGSPLQAGDLLDEPPWPHCALPVDPDERWRAELPFVPEWHAQPRLHRRIGPGSEISIAITRDRADGDWLRSRFGFDPSRYPELIGGLVLLAPDPLLRSVSLRRVPADGRDTSASQHRLAVRLSPWPGVNVDDVEVCLDLYARDGLVAGRWLSGARLVHVVDHAGMPAISAGYAVRSRRLGVTARVGPRPFLDAIQLRTGVGSVRKEITAPGTRRRGATEETRTVTEYDHEDRSVHDGASAGPDPRLARWAAAAEERHRQRQGERYGQRWFDEAASGRSYLRDIIGRARDRLWLCDPYLGDLEVLWFAQETTDRKVAIRLLTSREAFDGKELSELASMAHQVRQLNRNRPEGSVEAKVLGGKRIALHDRFLVADDEVWFSGNSFGTLGERAGAVLRLPDPAPVREKLDALFAGAQDFGPFALQRLRDWRKAHSPYKFTRRKCPDPFPLRLREIAARRRPTKGTRP